ncbi:MAG: universal stress protein [Thermodesulfobacteriota bacterium]
MNGTEKETKLLVAVDGSPASEAALKYAVYLATKLGARLVAVYVMEEEKIGYWIFIDEHFKKELRTKAQEVLDSAARIARDRDLGLETEILEGGRPYEEIVKYVEGHTEIAMVIMGERGLGHVDLNMLGSTTERVIRLVAKRGLPVVVTVVPGVEPDSPQCRLYGGPLCV